MKHTRWILSVFTALAALGLPASAGGPRWDNDQSIQARFGGFFLNGDGDFWSDSEALFSLEASDFDDFALGVTYSHAFNRFFELDLNADFYESTVVSEYNDYTDGAGFPILHDSTLETDAVTVGLRFLPFGRGDAGSRKPVFFLGAGGGVNFWHYDEIGDFIDFSDPMQPIIFGAFHETGEAFVGYAACGIELPLARNFSLGLEGRFFDSDDKLKGDFAGLGTLDMSGYSASVSANWRF